MLKSPLVGIAIRWGLITGTLAVMLMMALFYYGQHPFMISPFLDFRILLFGVMIYFALREYREYHQEGLLYFWQGMIGSFILIVVAGTVASVLLLIFMQFEDRFISSYIPLRLDYLQSFSEEDIQRIGKDVFERNLEVIKSTNAIQMAQIYFGQSLIIGFFVSIILSVILRKTT